MVRAAALSLVQLLVLSIVTPCSAQSTIYNGPNGTPIRCPADEMNCTIYNAPDQIYDRVKQGQKDVQDTDTIGEKVKAVKRTLQDCQQCAIDAIKGQSAH